MFQLTAIQEMKRIVFFKVSLPNGECAEWPWIMYFLLLSVLIEVLLLLQTLTRTPPMHYQQVDSTTCLIFTQDLKNCDLKFKKI